jgi:hypothetical protein
VFEEVKARPLYVVAEELSQASLDSPDAFVDASADA